MSYPVYVQKWVLQSATAMSFPQGAGGSSPEVTFDAVTDLWTASGGDWASVCNGAACVLGTSGTLPAGFTAGTMYYIRVADAASRKFALHLTESGAVTGADKVNGASSGSGIHIAQIAPAYGTPLSPPPGAEGARFVRVQAMDGALFVTFSGSGDPVGALSGAHCVWPGSAELFCLPGGASPKIRIAGDGGTVTGSVQWGV